MDTSNSSRNNLLRNTGAVVSLLSLVLAALVTFTLPSGCSFVTSIFLMMLFLLIIAGGLVFITGLFLVRREHRLKPS